MGAYAHPRLLQFVLGGVTDTMLREAKVPVLYSH
jgi:nucleotide-binding universal stress UspA family protein